MYIFIFDYQKGTGMIGMGYHMAMQGLESGAKLTNGLIMLDGLSLATAQNTEIRDISTQINIETGCYDSIQSPEMRLALATFNTALNIHFLNAQLKANPELLEKLKQQQQPTDQKKLQETCS